MTTVRKKQTCSKGEKVGELTNEWSRVRKPRCPVNYRFLDILAVVIRYLLVHVAGIQNCFGILPAP